MRFGLCLYWCLLNFGPLLSQEFVSRVYTTDDGLPGNFIFGVKQDSQGHLWIGSTNGVTRFDGTDFKNFGAEINLPSFSVRRIHEDGMRNIWLGTQTGMVQFDASGAKHFSLSDSATINFTFDICNSPEKKIWWLTDKGLYQFEYTYWRKLPSHVPGLFPRQIAVTENQIFYNYGNRILVEKKSSKLIVGLKENEPLDYYRIMRECQGRVFVQTNYSLFEIKDARLVPVLQDELNESKRIFLFWFLYDSKGRYWLSTEQGLWVYSSDKKRIIKKIKLPHVVVSDLMEDKFGNIWVATAYGLLKVSEVLHEAMTLSSQIGIASSYVTKDGSLLLSITDDVKGSGYVESISNDSYERPIIKTILKNEIVDSYAEDNLGNLWMSSRIGKIHRINKQGSLSITPEPDYLWVGDIKLNFKNQKLYVASEYLLVYEGDKFKRFVSSNGAQMIKGPSKIYFDKNDNCWVSTNYGKLFIISPDGNLKEMNQMLGIKPIFGSEKLHFAEDRNKNMWVASPGQGLRHYRVLGDSLSIDFEINVKNGLPNNFIKAIQLDGEGNLWAVTHSGPVFIEFKNENDDFLITYLKDQFQNEKSWQSSLQRNADGQIILTASNNVYKFFPKGLTAHREPPAIVIDGVSSLNLASDSIDTEPFSNKGFMTFRYYENNIKVSYHAIHLSNQPLQFSFRLSKDDPWGAAINSKDVTFLDLKPGSYSFEVRTRHLNTNWSKPVATNFTVLPPFWGTWIFRGLAGILIFFVATGVIISYTKRIKAKQQVLNQIKELELRALKSQMNPHFIFNAMNSIQSLIADENSTEALRYTSKFSKLLRIVLEDSEQNFITVEKEIKALELYIQIETLRLDFNLEYKIEIHKSVSLKTDVIPPLIIQPYVENALWHGLSSKKGLRELRVWFFADEEYLFCEVTDNGIGRKKSSELKNKAGNLSKGHSITEKRLAIINQLDSVPAVVMTDLIDENGNAMGTRVLLKISRNLKQSS